MQQMFVPVLKQTLVDALSDVFLYGLILLASALFLRCLSVALPFQIERIK